MSQLAQTTNFTTALRLQFRVVGALILREMRVRYGRSQLGYMWALAEPAAYIAAFSAMFIFAQAAPPYGRSMPLFFALGVIPFRLFMALGNQLGSAFDANEALLTYPIVKELDTVIARFILEVMTAVAVMLIVLGVLIATFDVPLPHNILRILEGLALIGALGFGVGLTNAVMTRFLNSWMNLFRMMMSPMIFLSGVFYSLDSLPTNARDVVVWNPVIHGVEMVRQGYYAHYRATGLDEAYLFWWALSATMAGLLLERAIRMAQR